MELNKKLKTSALFILITSTLIIGAYIDLNKKILLTVDGQTVEINTVHKTVESFLINENINIKEGCRINPSLDTEIKKNMKVIVTNPYNIKVIDGTDVISYKTNQETVEDVLKESNINLNSKDILNKKLSSRLSNNETIVITRVKEEVYKIIKDIPFEVIYINDSKLLKGRDKKDIVGEKGKLEVTYKIIYKNGEEISKEKISEKILKEPVKEIIRTGTLKANSI